LYAASQLLGVVPSVGSTIYFFSGLLYFACGIGGCLAILGGVVLIGMSLVNIGSPKR